MSLSKKPLSDVLLVDDQKIMRDGIGAILSRTGMYRIAGEAENGSEAVQQAKLLRPQIVLMEIGLPGLNGADTTQEILRVHRDCKIVVLSAYDDRNSVLGVIQAGAQGFVLKRASESDLMDALRMVMAGGIYVSPAVSGHLLTPIRKGAMHGWPAGSPVETLSPRELQVLRLVAEGNTNKDIGNLLDLSDQTIRSYRKTMMRKVHVNNVAGLTQLAVSIGLKQRPEFPAPDLSPKA